MVRGVPPERHGITSNTFTPLVRPVPSLFEAAAVAQRTVGMFYNWEQLRDLAAPGSTHISVHHGDCTGHHSDTYIAEQAVQHLQTMDFDLLFVYFGYPDECGHKHGWMSAPYLEAISHADSCLGRVLEAIEQRGWAEETTTLLLSDHGGHDRSHGTDCDEDMTIPWVLQGMGVKQGFEIPAPVRIYDTCVTLAHLLGIPTSPHWEGRIIQEALSESGD
jgi:bisphosphoglycerate-independent phosphoglycerate mutase (AlkP superfamily)